MIRFLTGLISNFQVRKSISITGSVHLSVLQLVGNANVWQFTWLTLLAYLAFVYLQLPKSEREACSRFETSYTSYTKFYFIKRYFIFLSSICHMDLFCHMSSKMYWQERYFGVIKIFTLVFLWLAIVDNNFSFSWVWNLYWKFFL